MPVPAAPVALDQDGRSWFARCPTAAAPLFAAVRRPCGSPGAPGGQGQGLCASGSRVPSRGCHRLDCVFEKPKVGQTWCGSIMRPHLVSVAPSALRLLHRGGCPALRPPALSRFKRKRPGARPCQLSPGPAVNRRKGPPAAWDLAGSASSSSGSCQIRPPAQASAAWPCSQSSNSAPVSCNPSLT